MKKKKSPKVVKLTVHNGGKDKAPWNSSVAGVLRRTLEEHDKDHFQDIVVVAIRHDGTHLFTYSTDMLRVLGVLTHGQNVVAKRLSR